MPALVSVAKSGAVIVARVSAICPSSFSFWFSGLTVGAVYALVALGFTLIYNASDVVNFAQGEFVMLGGMVTVFASAAGVSLPVAALIAVAVTIAVGLLLYWLAIQPARGASAVTLIIITIGASILLRGTVRVLFDKQFHKLPSFSGDSPVNIFGAAVQPQSFLGVRRNGVHRHRPLCFSRAYSFGKSRACNGSRSPGGTSCWN